MRSGRRAQRGFVAAEFVGAVALLLLPSLMLVAALPRWSEREHAATVVAREVARAAARAWPEDLGEEVDEIVEEVAADLGLEPTDLSVTVTTDPSRGGQVTATATIVMPAMVVPGMGAVGHWSWSTTSAARVDDLRSR